MAISSGARLGRYEVLGLLGAGGMGEVYRAYDPSLERTVALKVLPLSVSSDRERLRRFEHEARAAGALNHPNVLAVYDVGSHEGAPYIVSELLEGETLRERLKGGSLGARRAVEHATQVAQGLAAAHEKGIVHRDLKPENLFLTRDGRVKILDFGLAKLHGDARGTAPEDETATGTRPGVVLGTVAYLSPEQARGLPADARSDIFALGVVLYEMLTGRRPFTGETTAEVMTAILREDPPPLGERVAPGHDRIVRRCLEKSPDERFQLARDLAFALEVGAAQETTPSAARSTPGEPPRRSRRRRVRGAAAVGAGLAIAAGSYFAGRQLERKPVPTFRQLTFRRGSVDYARFAPDGETVVYGARWDGKASEVFATRLDLAESQALSLVQGAHPEGVQGGEVLVLRDDQRLARIPLVGGTPRDIAENVDVADGNANGDIAVVRKQWPGTEKASGHRLEYPIGTTVFESAPARPLRDVSVSRRGDRVAVVVGVSGSNGGGVVVVDRRGTQLAVSTGWMEVGGLGWSPDDREVWFTAGGPTRGGTGIVGALKALHAVSLSGRERLLLRTAGDLTLLDVSPDGRALVAHGRTRMEARGRLAGDPRERDLTYLDGTIPMGISADGRTVLFQESGQAGGPQNTSFLLRVGDSGPVRLGAGMAVALSPSGRLAIVQLGDFHQSGNRLVLLSVGPEPPRELSRGPVESYGGAAWLPDGERLIVHGTEKGRDGRLYVQLVPDGDLRPISPEGWTLGGTPSSHWVPCFRSEPDEKGRPARTWRLCDVEGGSPRAAPWVRGEAVVLAWSDDGRHALVADFWQPPFRVFRVDTSNGRVEPWLDTSPPDPAGIRPEWTQAGTLTSDGRHYVYSYSRTLSDLLLVEGLK